jgi:type IV pilus assembly protein PilF
MGLARIYDLELGQDLATDHFKKALRYEESTEAHFQYGVYLYNQSNLKGAYREFKTVLKDTVYGRRAQALEYQGVVASRLGKIDEAIDNYRRAIALNPMLANSHIGLTNIYFEQQEWVKSYSSYNGFISLVRAQLARHNASTLWLGIQLADNQEDSNALSSYSLQLRNLFPDSNEYQMYLAWKAERDEE